jgi:hypothetical protein
MKIGRSEFTQDNLTGTQWIGIVEDTEDPKFEGRIKVRVYGKFDGRVDPSNPNSDYLIPTENLPWARPANILTGGSNTGGGRLDIPKIGSEIQITFDNGDIYAPTYHFNLYPSDELKEEVQGSYQNSHVLIYDTAFALSDSTPGATNEREGEGIKVFFTEERGFVIDYATANGSTIINIKNDNTFEVTNANGDSIVMSNDGNITLTHTGTVTVNAEADVEVNCVNAKISATSETHINSPSIRLGEQAAEAVIKGDTFKTIFDSHIHPTGVGPSGPPTISMGTALSTKNKTD